ncbi:MAG TPA: SDR family oxidoreductase [Longimicrobiales bacterium]|nr:SDR family oxidoreductase [Longimicrobiales bacterium]
MADRPGPPGPASATPDAHTVARALVTGASGGLGADIARELAARGTPLVLTARSREPMEALARELGTAHGVPVLVLALDLATPDAGNRLADEVEAAGVEVDLLVNNAGFGQWGPWPGLDPEQEAGMIRLNVEALTCLTRRFVPAMIRRGRGRVLNVASTAAFLPGPGMAVYYATKAYVLSFSEALAEELQGTGVTVTCLCPGPTPTGFQARIGADPSALLRGAVLPSRTVARAGVEGALKGRRLVVPGLLNKLTTLAPRFLPRSWVPKLVKRVQDGRAPTGS